MTEQNGVGRSSELLPCPFCGARADVAEGDFNGRMVTSGFIVHRRGCWFCIGLPWRYQYIPLDEFSAWNRRAGDAE